MIADTEKGAGGEGADATARAAAATAQAAAEAAQTTADAVADKTSDLDVLHVETTWETAPADEAQFTAYADASTNGQYLRNTSPARIDDWQDRLTGSEVWTVDARFSGLQRTVIRIKSDLSPIVYRQLFGGLGFEVSESDKIGEDDTWDYYIGNNTGSGSVNERITLQKRVQHPHTAYHGELSGVALDQVNTKQDALTQTQQIGLLKFDASPPTVQRVHADEFRNTSFNIFVDNPQLLTGDVWYDRRINENALNSAARTKWTNTTFSISLPVPDNSSTRDQLLAAIVGVGIGLELRFYDAATGGNGIGIIRVMVGGATALGTAPLATKALYDGIPTKRNNRIYLLA